MLHVENSKRVWLSLHILCCAGFKYLSFSQITGKCKLMKRHGQNVGMNVDSAWCQGFFSKLLMGGGTQNFRSPSPTGTKSDGGGDLRKKSEAKTAHLMQNYAIFCYFKHEIQLFKVLLSLKISQIWHKNVFKFFKFSGTNSAGGGGPSLGLKTGTSVRWGDWQNFHQMGDPPVPPGKKKPGCHIHS